jgi:hypothetical protein
MLLKPTSVIFMHSTFTAPPPTKPPVKPRFGEYCFKAICSIKKQKPEDLIDMYANTVRFIAYDTEISLASQSASLACKEYCRHNFRKEKHICTEPDVVMLTGFFQDKECRGEVYFEQGSQTKKLL